MKLPDTLWEQAMAEIAHMPPDAQERYIKHFIGDDTETVELLAVKSETEHAHFALPAEALAALEEITMLAD